MTADQKFLGLVGLLFALSVVYRVAPGHALVLGALLLAAAYFAVTRRSRR